MRHHGRNGAKVLEQPAVRDATAIVKLLDGKVPEDHLVIQNLPDEHRIEERTSVKLRTVPVCWALPTDEVLFARFFTNFLRLRPMPWDDMYSVGSTYLPDARNTLHAFYVEKSLCGHMVMLDSDVLPPPDFLERLLAHNLPMVGGWYRKKGDPYPPCVYDYVNTSADGVAHWRGRLQPGTGLEQVDGAGAGCWLMRRDVAVALGSRPYDMNSGGEDMKLCLKVRELGIPMHIDWTVACAHVGVAYT